MQSVNIAELRSRLSTYLERVHGGEEILVRNRRTAIARIVPVSRAGELSEELERLAAQGIIRLPEEKLDLKAFCALPGPKVNLDKLRAAVEAEHEED